MNDTSHTLIVLTLITAALVFVVALALLRFISAARETRRGGGGRSESALMSSALQEAVTALKGQEQAMSARAAASEQLSTLIVESLTAGLLLVDADGRVEILNPAGRRMLDVPGASAVVDYRELLTGSPALADVIGECLSSGQPIVRRALSMPVGSQPSHLGVTVSPLGSPSAPRGAICLFSDLTAVVELEEQLRLKETLARLGELTAGIAHEFRNGLATIHGYSRLIDPQSLPPEYRPYVKGIRDETAALGTIVTNFLNFAKPEHVSLSRVDLGEIAGRAAEDLRHELPAGTRIDIVGSVGEVQGDEVLLRQVFGNLIRNASEACEAEGRVAEIRVSGVADPSDRTCRVCVDDNGPGIPEAARARIFQPFVTTRTRGTGLGLAIVQKVVLMHNGRVSVGESPSGGTSIQMRFPIADS